MLDDFNDGIAHAGNAIKNKLFGLCGKQISAEFSELFRGAGSALLVHRAKLKSATSFMASPVVCFCAGGSDTHVSVC